MPFLPCVVPREELRRNHRLAAGRGLPWLAAHPPRDVPLAIVGGGESAAEEIETLLDWPGDILAINGAYNWLCECGRVPDWVLAIDPQPLMARFVYRARLGTRFIVASCCDPTVFDVLEGRPVILCDIRQGKDRARPGDIPGGPSAMCRAPQVGIVLGYREVVLFGADCCIRGPMTHVYGDVRGSEIIEVEVDGQIWRTTPQMLGQAEYLAQLLPALHGHLRIGIAGDHLTSQLLENEGVLEMAKKRVYEPLGDGKWKRHLVEADSKTPKGMFDSQAECEASMEKKRKTKPAGVGPGQSGGGEEDKGRSESGAPAGGAAGGGGGSESGPPAAA